MEEPRNSEKNPVVVFISNVLSAIKVPPFLLKQQQKMNMIEPGAAEPIKTKPAEVENATNSKPLVVTYPKQTFTPLKLEAEAEGPDRTTNPLILWQVYAIGGYYVLRWAWSKWNEHKGQDRSDDDEPPPTSD